LVLIVLATLLFLGALVLVGLLVRKVMRSRRRRRGDPRRRVVGAWQESIDLLVEAGLPDLTSATTSEIETATAVQFGDEPARHARAVGAAADVAIFHPATDIDDGDADAAWRAHATLSRAVHRSLGWRDRMAARLRYNRPHRRAPSEPPVATWASEMKARADATRGRVDGGRHRLRQR
jgi:hypothetical protein